MEIPLVGIYTKVSVKWISQDICMAIQIYEADSFEQILKIFQDNI